MKHRLIRRHSELISVSLMSDIKSCVCIVDYGKDNRMLIKTLKNSSGSLRKTQNQGVRLNMPRFPRSGRLALHPARRINQHFPDQGFGRVPVFHVCNQAGFTTLELIIVVVIIAIASSMAIVNVRPAILGLRANGAMYQVITTIREARMLAMSEDRMVSLQFPGTNNGIAVMIRQQNAGAASNWANISVATAQRRTDPSITLGDRYKFSRNNSYGSPPGGSLIDGAVVFADTVVTANNILVFTGDGLLTLCATNQINTCNLDDPVNGTIYIAAPDGNEKLARALTIRGATGSITAWQRRNGNWARAR